MLCSHSFFPSERALWLRSHYWRIYSHRCVLLPWTGHTSSSLTALCPNTAVLFAFVWVGAVQMVLELFMEAVWCFTEAEAHEWKGEWWRKENALWECLFWSSFLRGAAVRLLACWDKPSDPHHSPSLPPPLSVQRFPSALTVSDKKIVL